LKRRGRERGRGEKDREGGRGGKIERERGKDRDGVRERYQEYTHTPHFKITLT
jgi:hypothetical protein